MDSWIFWSCTARVLFRNWIMWYQSVPRVCKCLELTRKYYIVESLCRWSTWKLDKDLYPWTRQIFSALNQHYHVSNKNLQFHCCNISYCKMYRHKNYVQFLLWPFNRCMSGHQVVLYVNMTTPIYSIKAKDNLYQSK